MQLTDLKFVSEKRERDFNKLNIYTVESLVRHYPRDYLDLRHVTLLKDAYHNDYILTAAEVTNVEVNRYARRPYVKAYCDFGYSGLFGSGAYERRVIGCYRLSDDKIS